MRQHAQSPASNSRATPCSQTLKQSVLSFSVFARSKWGSRRDRNDVNPSAALYSFVLLLQAEMQLTARAGSSARFQEELDSCLGVETAIRRFCTLGYYRESIIGRW